MIAGDEVTPLACRSCGRSDLERVLDLGAQPLATHFPLAEDPPDPTWPLLVAVCPHCWLLQLEPSGAPPERDAPEMRALATQSSTLRAQARANATRLRERLVLTPDSVIVELGSHGNRMREAFASLGLRTVIIEPDIEAAAELGGVPAGVHAAAPGRAAVGALRDAVGAADLIVDDFLLAHLPDFDDAIAGLGALLAPNGTLVLTVDHALSVVAETQFDALRHGHHAVLSLLARSRCWRAMA